MKNAEDWNGYTKNSIKCYLKKWQMPPHICLSWIEWIFLDCFVILSTTTDVGTVI
jgi:hypothetical protein